MDDIVASRVVGSRACDDDGLVQCRDALSRDVVVQVGEGRAGEDLEDGGVDVEHALRGELLVCGVDEVVHCGGHMIAEQAVDCGDKVCVGVVL